LLNGNTLSINNLPMDSQYETVFIATPVLSEQQMKETAEKYKGIIRNHKGEIVHEENWGLRKLAYPIENKSTGFYYLIEFKGPGKAIENLEIEYKRDERVIRFLTIKMDKYAVEYSEKQRREKNAASQKSTEKNTEEE
jgi:small subunit ribosomal protein S6